MLKEKLFFIQLFRNKINSDNENLNKNTDQKISETTETEDSNEWKLEYELIYKSYSLEC